MKNIHILPTPNPSRLAKLGMSDNLQLFDNLISFKTFEKSPQNIYITSDEEIKAKEYILIIREGLLIGKLGEIVLIESTKEGRTDYVRMDGTRGWFASDVNYQKDWNYKKIILTDNKDLIKDGVQPIPDEFLEWFVKNPSCEEIKVDKVKIINYSFPRDVYNKYKIIIPKEERERGITITHVGKPKQETLEEFIERASDECNIIHFSKYEFEKFIKLGAKWQQEQDKNKYSDEDFKLFARQYFREIKMDKSNLLWEDLADKCLEQFKKK